MNAGGTPVATPLRVAVWASSGRANVEVAYDFVKDLAPSSNASVNLTWAPIANGTIC